jgi:hypothetical protein
MGEKRGSPKGSAVGTAPRATFSHPARPDLESGRLLQVLRFDRPHLGQRTWQWLVLIDKSAPTATYIAALEPDCVQKTRRRRQRQKAQNCVYSIK